MNETLDAIDLDPVHRVRLNPSEADLSLAKAQKIADRTRKQGLEGGYKVWLDTEVEVRKDALGREHKVVWKVLCWEGEPVRLPGGWKFIAVVEWLGDTPITRMMPDYEGEMIDREWIAESYCDHCQTKRRRKHVVVVEDAEGTRKRVGSTCCRDYLGWDFRPTFLPDPSDSDDDFGGGAVPWTISTHYLLDTAAMMARGFGWVPASRAGEIGATSTAVGAVAPLGPSRSRGPVAGTASPPDIATAIAVTTAATPTAAPAISGQRLRVPVPTWAVWPTEPPSVVGCPVVAIPGGA